jgi:hypothetical protein
VVSSGEQQQKRGNTSFLKNGFTDFDYILILYTGNGPKQHFV